MLIPRTPVSVPSADVMAYWIKKGFDAYGSVPFHGADDAPNSWKALIAWASTHKLGKDSLPVFNGGCDATIYGDAETNMIFRAWHDCIHIRENLGFSQADELKVADHHCNVLKWVGAPYAVVKAVEADVKGQVLYYFKHNTFVNDQAAFVVDCLKNGIDRTIESGKIY
tara:strand:+ start:1145 stop:1648 length:504 start_codon:yes stop_codon:yes gene_type:complete